MTIDELRAMRDAGDFHHATYRNRGTLWEGLWIYRRDPDGFRGYAVAGAFLKDSPEIDAAYDAVRGTGISLDSYGVG